MSSTRKNRRRQAILLTALLAAGALSAGCGGGGEATGSGAAAASSPALTKVAFVKQGDAICAKSDKRQRDAYKAFQEKHSSKDLATKSGQEEIITEVGLPAVTTEIGELRQLGAPKGEEAKVAAILNGAEAAVKEAEAKPSSALQGTGPFVGVEKLVKDFGFKVCGLI